jgi:VanZ family protein
MYGFFGLVALLESRCPYKCHRFHFALISSILVLSTLIEVLQATVVATRSAEWLDLVANLLGLLGGYLVYRILISLGMFKTLRS